MIRESIEKLLPATQITGEPERLTGGLMNEVWRVPARPAPVIFKHAPPYIASAPDIPLDSNRIYIEANCLEALGPGGRLANLSTPAVRPPHLYARDDATHVLLMEDVGPAQSLLDGLLAGNVSLEAGVQLGQFLATLHTQTAFRTDLDEFVNLPIQQTRLEVQYKSIGPTLKKAGIRSAKAIGKAAEALGKRLLKPGTCLIMGDLWPASILLTKAGIRIIDWEFAHIGNPAQDAAHLSAHLWMIAHAHPEIAEAVRAFESAFKSAYFDAVDKKLWPLQVHADAEVHFKAEVVVRALGPFKSGYLFEGRDGVEVVRAVV